MSDCTQCQGKGYEYPDGHLYEEEWRQDCGACDGTGEAWEPVVYTVRHYALGVRNAEAMGDTGALRVLREHHYHAGHCGGYEVAAWPCPTAAAVLRRLYVGEE